MGIADDWSDHARSRFPVAPSPRPLASRLLTATMHGDESLAAVRLPGARGAELQIHRVRAGRYGTENAVAVCALPCQDAGDAAQLRLREGARIARWWRRAPWLARLAVLFALPLLLLGLPGYLLIVGIFTVLKWLRGVRRFDRLLPTALRPYAVEAQSEAAARRALGARVLEALAETRDVERFQIEPGVLVAERLLDHPDALDGFLRDLGAWTR